MADRAEAREDLADREDPVVQAEEDLKGKNLIKRPQNACFCACVDT